MGRKVGLREALSKEHLSRLYIQERKSMNDLAGMFQCTKQAIYHVMDDYGIPRRNSKDSRKTAGQDLISKEELFELYTNQGLTTLQIEDKYGKKPGFVSRLLKIYGIPARSYILGLKHLVSKEDLVRLYTEEHKSTKEIAMLYGCHPKSLTNLMDQYGIARRKGAEAHKKSLRDRLPREVSLDLYINQKRTTMEIGNMYGINQGSVSLLLAKYGIQARQRKDIEKKTKIRCAW